MSTLDAQRYQTDKLSSQLTEVFDVFEDVCRECLLLWPENEQNTRTNPFVIDKETILGILTRALIEQQIDPSADEVISTKRRITAEYVRSDVSADDRDCVAIFENSSPECFYALISSGAGDERKTALSEHFSSAIFEKLLTLGYCSTTVIRLFDAFLRANGLSSTIDFMDLNLNSGHMRVKKCGAPPTYVLREGNLFALRSRTNGICGSDVALDCEQISLTVETGDIIIMLNDAANQCFEEKCWSSKLFSNSWEDEDDFCTAIKELLTETGLINTGNSIFIRMVKADA